MTLVLKTVDSCEPRGGKIMGLLQASIHTSTYQQHQEREAMARFRNSKGKDMVLLFGDKVEVYKRSRSALSNVKHAIGHTTPQGQPYVPIGTPRTPTHIATRFPFPILPGSKKQQQQQQGEAKVEASTGAATSPAKSGTTPTSKPTGAKKDKPAGSKFTIDSASAAKSAQQPQPGNAKALASPSRNNLASPGRSSAPGSGAPSVSPSSLPAVSTKGGLVGGPGPRGMTPPSGSGTPHLDAEDGLEYSRDTSASFFYEDEDDMEAQIEKLQARYGKVDFYGKHEYRTRRKELQRKARNQKGETDDEYAGDASEMDQSAAASGGKPGHHRYGIDGTKKDKGPMLFRRRHHRLCCKYHPDNMVSKFRQTGYRHPFRFPLPELEESNKRISKSLQGHSFVDDLEEDLDFDAIFQPLTVELTMKRKAALTGQQQQPQRHLSTSMMGFSGSMWSPYSGTTEGGGDASPDGGNGLTPMMTHGPGGGDSQSELVPPDPLSEAPGSSGALKQENLGDITNAQTPSSTIALKDPIFITNANQMPESPDKKSRKSQDAGALVGISLANQPVQPGPRSSVIAPLPGVAAASEGSGALSSARTALSGATTALPTSARAGTTLPPSSARGTLPTVSAMTAAVVDPDREPEEGEDGEGHNGEDPYFDSEDPDRAPSTGADDIDTTKIIGGLGGIGGGASPAATSVSFASGLNSSVTELPRLESSANYLRSKSAVIGSGTFAPVRSPDGSPGGAGSGPECDCTPRSTSSSSNGEAIELTVKLLRRKFHRTRCQLDKSLLDALDARKKARGEVYRDRGQLAIACQHASDKAAHWLMGRNLGRPDLKHPRTLNQKRQQEEAERRFRELAQAKEEQRKMQEENWSPLLSPPEAILKRPSKVYGDTSNPQLVATLQQMRGVSGTQNGTLPLQEVGLSHDPTVWVSMWNMRQEEKSTRHDSLQQCIDLYRKIVSFCLRIGYPNTAFQEQFVGHLRKVLMQGEVPNQNLLFDLLLKFDRRSIESRDSMKLIHFMRDQLGITYDAFFDWLQAHDWKLTVELKNLKKRLANENRLQKENQ